ncbi:MAG: HD domain-containing phosphohydrolase [Pirellulaceae bacterium]|nr:HD domain-containing phosphohydrolase [Pirellulaceae bacterium]
MEFSNRRILVVDDNESIHEDFRQILAVREESTRVIDSARDALLGDSSSNAPKLEPFDLSYAFQGKEGLDKIVAAKTAGRPFAVAFVDIRMPPGWDGVETVEKIFADDDQIQVVLCTAYSDYSFADIIGRFGYTDRLMVLKKPFDVAEAALFAVSLTEKWRLAMRAESTITAQQENIEDAQQILCSIRECHDELQNAHEGLREESRDLEMRLEERTAELMDTRDITVFALAQLADSRDPETGEHLQRMRAYAQELALYLSENGPYVDDIDDAFLESFYRSTPLHDIGKVGIPDNILLKPGKLTHEEFEVMKQHTVIGAAALGKSAAQAGCGDFLRMAAEIALYHHEKFNGTGYPEGLTDYNIPLSARITAVADVFDALTSDRVYKVAMDPEEARQLICGESEAHFDPEVVQAFEVCYERLLEMRAEINYGRSSGDYFDSASGSQVADFA